MTTIHQRIALVMRDLRGVEKTGRHQQGYAYAGHEAVATAIRPLFVEHGIVQSIHATPARLLDGGHIALEVTVRWTSIESATDYVEGTVPALQQCQSKAGNPTAQQVGQAISYAVKNFQLKTLMLLDSNEEEGESLPHESPHVVNRTAEDMLARFAFLSSEAELKAHLDACRARWAEVKDVPGLGSKFAALRDETLKRIKGTAT
jgi:hypothetical protein